MSNIAKLLITFGIFLIPPFVFARLILIPRISRVMFSLFCTLLVGFQLFFVTLMYADYKPWMIGGILFIFAFLGCFPVFYLLYPGLKSRIEKYAKSNQ